MRALVILAVTAALLAGCGSADGAGGGEPDAAFTGTPACPETLAEGSAGAEPAAAAPDLPAFDTAWLCVFELGDAWTLTGGPALLDDVSAVRDLVGALTPADPSMACTMELGPEYLLVLASGDARTDVVIDTYGCRIARVDGTPGTLMGPDTMIADLDALAGL